MHSFVECLRSVCRDVKPRRIIEWGPGKSTVVLREECGADAIIISVEHNPKYAKIARETNHANHVFEFDAACYKSRYAVWPLESFDKEQRFDLAFVDGRRRVECALVAWMLLRDGGALILHDAHRWHYAILLRYYLGDPEGGAYAVDHDTCVWVKGNRQALRRAGEKPERIDMPDDYQEPNDPTLEEEAEARSRVAFCSALARQFHERYEEIAPLYGYKTREDTKTFDPESPNGQLMQAVCLQVVGPIVARLQAIASMPEYDQDDAHRLRDMARRFLSQNPSSDDRPNGQGGKHE